MNHDNVPPIIADSGKNYALLPVALTVYDEESRTVYHINSFYTKPAPEMGAVLDAVMLEKADHSA